MDSFSQKPRTAKPFVTGCMDIGDTEKKTYCSPEGDSVQRSGPYRSYRALGTKHSGEQEYDTETEHRCPQCITGEVSCVFKGMKPESNNRYLKLLSRI